MYIGKRLYRSYKDHHARYNAYLDDYAFFIAALLDLYEASQDIQWLKKAIELDEVLENLYEDKENGGFFMTSNDHEALIAREKPSYDGALPSGNSIAVLNLMRLNEFTTKDSYRQRAEKALTAFSGTLASHPMALAEMLLAVDFFLDDPKEIIIVAPEGKKSGAEPFLHEFRNQYLPNRILTVVAQGKALESLQDIIPLTQSKIAQNGSATAYVCESGVCKLPTDDPREFARQIKTVKTLATDSKDL
ncbi:MAG: thioredoxin domain-containing protein [Deltaproteobacteria bacterium]|nr:thioredoxin domain-containing protein [Deltaproteobacteria bacterium]